MKKLLIIVGIILSLFVLTIVLVPILFKDRIVSAIQTELDSSVNAHVNFELENIRLSLLKDFPNLTIGIQDLSVTGKELFVGDTLFSTKDIAIEIDIMAIIKSEPLNIKGIVLDQPLINILVLEDGNANYDITYPTEEEKEETPSQEEFKFGIDHWEIKQGRIVYYDQAVDMAMALLGVNHTGNGDFTLSVFDMDTKTTAEDFSFAYEGVVYVAHKKLAADMLFGMDMDNWKFTFKDAKASLNEFHMNFDGFFAMPTSDYEMDINFSTTDSEFKNILSLVPGMYADGFDNLATNGDFDFSGYVTGIYSETKMPSFLLDLAVRDAYVKSPDVPLPVEKIGMELHIRSESGDMKDGLLEIKNFALTIDKDRFTANAVVNNFDSPDWDLKVQGILNLDIISKIEPTEDFIMAGIINANIISKGAYTDVENENYGNLQTAGQLTMKNFSFATKGSPPIKVSTAELLFNPESINLSSFSGNYGKSDFILNGQLENYIAYTLKKEAILKGELNLSSQLLDINEIMGVSEEDSIETEENTPMEVIIVPNDLNFVFNATAKSMKYDNFDMKNAVGKIIIRDGIMTMDPMKFDMLGGIIKMTGTYDSRDEYEPKFEFNLGVEDLSIAETFQNVTSVQKFVPVAEKMTGKFSTDFVVNGLMTQEMMPDLATMAGSGLIKIANASIKDSKVINGITSLSKLDNTSDINLKDVKLQAEIKDGKLNVKPFDVNIGKYKATIDGSTALDGAIAYNLKMNVPTGSVGQAANQAISGLLGSTFSAVGNSIDLNFNIGGTYDDPKIGLGKVNSEDGGSVTSSVKGAVTDKVNEEKDKLKSEINTQVEIAKDSANAEAERLKKQAEEEAQKKAEEEKERLKNKAKNKMKDIFGNG